MTGVTKSAELERFYYLVKAAHRQFAVFSELLSNSLGGLTTTCRASPTK